MHAPALHAHSTVTPTGKDLHLGLAEGRPLPLRGVRPAIWQDLPWRGGNAPGLQACRRAQHPSGQRDLVRRATLKQAKRVTWNRLKRNIPEDWIRPAERHQLRDADEDRPRHARGRSRRPGCAARQRRVAPHTVVRRRQARLGFPAHAPARLPVRLRVIPPRLRDNARLGRSPSGRDMPRIAGKAMPDTRVIGHTKTPRHFP
jgi:hypothetical protein